MPVRGTVFCVDAAATYTKGMIDLAMIELIKGRCCVACVMGRNKDFRECCCEDVGISDATILRCVDERILLV